MSVNPFFRSNYFSENEQKLLRDSHREIIQIHGFDVEFIPRELIKPDAVYGEDPISQFNESYTIEAYFENVEGFGGQNDIITKLGILEIRDQATLLIHRERFDTVVDGKYNRPREGDLIYFGLSKGLFQISFVEHENFFYQLGGLYVYKVKIELFQYSNQFLSTGNMDIDTVEDAYAAQLPIALDSGSGLYKIHETVYQGANLGSATAKAVVISHDLVGKKLVVKRQVGNFIAGTPVVGVTSNANWTVATTDPFNLQNQALSTNKEIRTEAQDFVDFSEDNPFSKDD